MAWIATRSAQLCSLTGKAFLKPDSSNTSGNTNHALILPSGMGAIGAVMSSAARQDQSPCLQYSKARKEAPPLFVPGPTPEICKLRISCGQLNSTKSERTLSAAQVLVASSIQTRIVPHFHAGKAIANCFVGCLYSNTGRGPTCPLSRKISLEAQGIALSVAVISRFEKKCPFIVHAPSLVPCMMSILMLCLPMSQAICIHSSPAEVWRFFVLAVPKSPGSRELQRPGVDSGIRR